MAQELADAAAKLKAFNAKLDLLIAQSPDDKDLEKALEAIKEQVKEKGLEELEEITTKVMGKDGAKIAKGLAMALDNLSAEGIK